MLKTIIQKNNYQDSIVLMLLTNEINTLDGVNNVSIMMATPANKDIFKTGGLYTPELEEGTPNDMAIVLDVDSEDVIETVLEEIKRFLEEKAKGNQAQSQDMPVAKTWDQALASAKDAKVAIVSIPGVHAPLEIERALDEGYHVFCFSDNVPVEDEARLKQKAHEKGLLLMGPDCGTGIMNGIPLAFTNVVRKGKIGIVGASGTGIQEVSSRIHQLGEGVSHAIGTGGRDLKEAIGGVTMLDSIELLAQDPETTVLVVLSKPATPVIQERVVNRLRALNKPVVTLFLGEKPTEHEENLYQAYTLEEAANLAVALVKEQAVDQVPSITPYTQQLDANVLPNKTIKGYYSGGTLASEAAMLIKHSLKLTDGSKAEGYMLKSNGHEIIDLGDDIYTQGKPHPMIDPTKRIELLQEAASDDNVAVVLLDVVLGYGSHENMAAELAPTIRGILDVARSQGREFTVVATVVGTDRDVQNIDEQKRIMVEAGAVLTESNAQAVQLALQLIGHTVDLPKKEVTPRKVAAVQPQQLPETMLSLLTNKEFLNIGLRSFSQAIQEIGGKVTQFDWKPIAGGNVELIKALQFLRQYDNGL